MRSFLPILAGWGMLFPPCIESEELCVAIYYNTTSAARRQVNFIPTNAERVAPKRATLARFFGSVI
jgi:hypothetical protein